MRPIYIVLVSEEPRRGCGLQEVCSVFFAENFFFSFVE